MSQASHQIMKYLDVALLTLLLALKHIHGAIQHQHGTFFQAIKDDGKENTVLQDLTSVIHVSFHKCGLDAACNYVIEDIKIKKYRMIGEEKDLPAEGNDMRKWEKEFMAVACENAILNIQCQGGLNIHIKDAVYGRLSKTICPNEYMFATNCAASNSFTKMKELCDEKQYCSMKASFEAFGDPCAGTVKYLQVQYQCL